MKAHIHVRKTHFTGTNHAVALGVRENPLSKANSMEASVDPRILAGAILTVLGSLEAVWAITTNGRRSLLAQGVVFIQLGLVFLIMALMPNGVMRNAIGITMAVSTLLSVGMQLKLLRTERRERSAHEEQNSSA